MGIACRGSVKAGCAAFVNPRTGFLMPVRFSVFGPRGLSCPSRPPLPLRCRTTPGAAVPAAASGGGAAGARSAHKGGGLGSRLWFGWPGGQRPPGRQTPPPPPGPRRSSPPLCQAYTLGKGRYPLLILLPSACPAPSRPPLPLRCRATPGAAVPAAASGGGGGRAQRAQRRGPWPPPLVWLAGGPKAPRPPNAAAPPAPSRIPQTHGLLGAARPAGTKGKRQLKSRLFLCK